MGCLEASSCFSAYVGQWFGYFIAFTVKRYTRLNVSGAHIHSLRLFCNRRSANEADTEVGSDTKNEIRSAHKRSLSFLWGFFLTCCLSHVIIVIARCIIKLVTYYSPGEAAPRDLFCF